MVKDKVGRAPGELGVSRSLGDRKDIQPVKKLDVDLLVVMI